MGGKTRSETASSFLRRVSDKSTDKEAKEWVKTALLMQQNQQVALSVLGTMTIVIMPGGGFHFALSPHLMIRRESLDWVDAALGDAQEYIRELRKKVTERDLSQAQQTAHEAEHQEE